MPSVFKTHSRPQVERVYRIQTSIVRGFMITFYAEIVGLFYTQVIFLKRLQICIFGDQLQNYR